MKKWKTAPQASACGAVFFRGESRTTFLPQSGPNFSLRPKAALLSKALPSAKHSAPRARDGRTRLPGGGRSAPPSLFGGAAATAFDAGSPWVGRPESIQSKGAPLRCAQWGTKRWCRLAVPEKNRRGFDAFCPSGSQKAPPTPPPGSREAPSPSKEGVQGARPHLPVGHSALNPPGAFLLDRQAARSLFPGKRERGAESASPWGR